MNKLENQGAIWCHGCQAPVDALTGVLRLEKEGESRDDIECLNCGAHLGYDTDWPETYGERHND